MEVRSRVARSWLLTPRRSKLDDLVQYLGGLWRVGLRISAINK
jgi:hypothetical protein